MWTYIVTSGQRRRCDLLSHWATVELCEAQAAHRGSGWVTLPFPLLLQKWNLGQGQVVGGCVMSWCCSGLPRGPGVARRGTAWLRPGLAAGLCGRLWSSPTCTIGVLFPNYFNNGDFLLRCREWRSCMFLILSVASMLSALCFSSFPNPTSWLQCWFSSVQKSELRAI